jgi:hypothetical protein
LDKHGHGYFEPGFLIRHLLYLEMTHNGTAPDRTTLSRLDRSQREIAAESKQISPWQLRVMGLLRSSWWAVSWPDVTDYTLEGIRLDYADFANNSATVAGGHYYGMEELRTKVLPQFSTKFVYDDRRPNWVYSAYEPFARLYYNGWYTALSVLALWGALYCVWRRQLELALPIYVFIANILINVYLLNVFSRYIHILDVLLVFQCALGVSLFLKQRRNARMV